MSKQPHADDDAPRGSRLKIESLWALVGLAFGFLILPALIYGVGAQMLGRYAGGNRGLRSFYNDFFQDLGSGQLNTWILALGPFILLLLLRLIFFRASTVEAERTPPPPAPRPKQRKEPTVNL